MIKDALHASSILLNIEFEGMAVTFEGRFARELEHELPALKERFNLVHLKTKRRRCRRLVYRPNRRPDGQQEVDYVTSHVLVLELDGLALFAIEAFVYESEEAGVRVSTLFVAKADTTGHYYHEIEAPLSIRRVTTGLVRGLLRYYVPAADRVRVCLFAKAEQQYLFPLSSQNPKKHVLGDAALVRWWLGVLEPLHDEFASLEKARLQIPGEDPPAIRPYFPRGARLPWQVGDVFWSDSDEDASSRRLPAVECIPRFPDDPKKRFLEFLVAERRARRTSRDQFWLELQSRQEFRLGSVVGIIGLQGTLPPENASYREAAASVPHALRYKDFSRLREALVSCDYSTKEAALEATAFFLQRVKQPFCRISIQGKNTEQKQKRTAQNAQVNLLSGSIVRKKKKT